MATYNAGGLQAYLRDVGRYPLLTHEETISLFREMRDATDEAKRKKIKAKLINSNLRLVINIAKKYKDNGIPLIDLIQEGNEGLMKGVERFDPEKGFRLSTYVTWWIKQAIRCHLTESSRTVRLPAHVVAMLPHLRAERRRIIDETGHEPTAEALAAALSTLQGNTVTPESVQAAMDASGPIYSVDLSPDDAQGKRSGPNLEQFMNDSSSWEHQRVDLEEAAFAGQLRDVIRRAFATLTPREEQVLRLRFGVMEDPESTEDRFSLSESDLKDLKKRMEAE